MRPRSHTSVWSRRGNHPAICVDKERVETPQSSRRTRKKSASAQSGHYPAIAQTKGGPRWLVSLTRHQTTAAHHPLAMFDVLLVSPAMPDSVCVQSVLALIYR